jgi:hypothetical protein
VALVREKTEIVERRSTSPERSSETHTGHAQESEPGLD